MIKLKQIEFFRAVMLYGSINRASHYLCVSQPVVSRTISQLERSIGLQLFERRTSHLVPTENAFVLNRYCDEIFETTTRLETVIKLLQGEKVDHLKFVASPALSNAFIPKLLAKYDKSTCIHFESCMLKDIAVNVESGIFEFGLTIWPIISNRINCTPIGESSFVFLCHETNPLSRLHKIRFDDFVDQEFIFTNRNNPIGKYIDRKVQEMGVNFDNYIEVDRSEIVCAIINAGRGVSIINSHGFDIDQWPHTRSIELDSSIHTNMYLITPKFGKLSPSADRFINFLKKEIEFSCEDSLL